MSDPNYRDPRIPPRPDEQPARRGIVELDRSNNAMWGWIAGAVAVLLVLIFVFSGGRDTSNTASTPTASPPAATTGSAPPAATPAPPATTGQGGSGTNAGRPTPANPGPANPSPGTAR